MLIGKTAYLLETLLTSYDNLEFALRIVLAALLGILVGTERSRRLKGAGVRTHCIVALTAAVFMILSKYAFLDVHVGEAGARGVDSARIAAQVVSGISFLGAGIIFKQGKNSVHGLTTAAGMWATAAIGMAIGAGMYWVGITETFVLLLMQTVLHRFHFANDILTDQVIEIRLPGDVLLDDVLLPILREHGAVEETATFTREEDLTVFSLRLRSRKPFSAEDLLQLTREHPEIVKIVIRDL